MDFKAFAYQGAGTMVGILVASGEPLEKIRAEINATLDRLAQVGELEQLHAIGARLTPALMEIMDDVSALARVAADLVVAPPASPAGLITVGQPTPVPPPFIAPPASWILPSGAPAAVRADVATVAALHKTEMAAALASPTADVDALAAVHKAEMTATEMAAALANRAPAATPKMCGACGAVLNPPLELGYCRACGAPIKETT